MNMSAQQLLVNSLCYTTQVVVKSALHGYTIYPWVHGM